MLKKYNFTFDFGKKVCEFHLNDEDNLSFYKQVLFYKNRKIVDINQKGFLAIQSFSLNCEPYYMLDFENIHGIYCYIDVFKIEKIDYFNKQILVECISSKRIDNISSIFNNIIKQEVLKRQDEPFEEVVGDENSLIFILIKEYALAHFSSKH